MRKIGAWARLSALLVALAGAVPDPARAACQGEDLRATLPRDLLAEVEAAASSVPHAQGNRWRATRGDRVIEVIGTFHVDDPRLDQVMPLAAEAIAGADRLFVEIAPKDQAELQARIKADPLMVFRVSGPTLPDLMTEERWQALGERLATRGIPAVLAAKMEPWFLAVMLAAPACALDADGRARPGLDTRLIALAEEAGLPIESLEEADTVFRLFRDLSLEEQVELLSMAIAGTDNESDGYVTMANLYFEEATALGWELTRAMALADGSIDREMADRMFARLTDLMLVRRNHAWIKRLRELGVEDRRIVVAAGAGHLWGKDGLLALLQADGYTLERLPFRAAD